MRWWPWSNQYQVEFSLSPHWALLETNWKKECSVSKFHWEQSNVWRELTLFFINISCADLKIFSSSIFNFFLQILKFVDVFWFLYTTMKLSFFFVCLFYLSFVWADSTPLKYFLQFKRLKTKDFAICRNHWLTLIHANFECKFLERLINWYIPSITKL